MRIYRKSDGLLGKYVIDGLKIAYRLLKVARRVTYRQRLVQPKVQAIVSDPRFRNSFCGYYDHTSFWPRDEDYILIQSTNAFHWRRPRPDEKLVLSLADWKRNRVVENLGETYAWNWQQGCRPLWLASDEYIFNVYDNIRGDYGAIVGKVGSSKIERLPLPVQECCGGKLYSINYAALARFRPDYGYRNRRTTDRDVEENGIVETDRWSGRTRRLLAVRDLVEATVKHWCCVIVNYKINHLLCSPGGERMVFLFRYVAAGKRRTDIYAIELSSGKCRLAASDCGASHYCWLSETEVLCTGRFGKNFGYVRLDCRTSSVKRCWDDVDGHPALVCDAAVVTDTYPDMRGVRSLYIRNAKNPQQKWLIGQFVEPFYLFGETRCDLHPSVTNNKKFVQIDVINGGSRKVAIIDLNSAHLSALNACATSTAANHRT